MPEFKKSDLVYPDLFDWEREVSDSPAKHLDGYKVSLKEGYEVVYFINNFINYPAMNRLFMSIEDGKHVEKLLLKLRDDKILSNMRLRKDVRKWVDDHWLDPV